MLNTCLSSAIFVPAFLLVVALVMIGCEILHPARNWPRVRGWWARVLLLNAFQAAIVWIAGLVWEPWMKAHRLWSADALFGTTGSIIIGYLAITFVYYWWHRWRHESAVLWRWVHQLHHSPQRIEVITSFYKHPLEIFLNGIIVSAILYMGVGLSVYAATVVYLMTGVAEFFYHWNVPTPVWVGYLIQRTESHCWHHQQGNHSGNYADLPLWDWLFGTFHNPPKQYRPVCGFGADAEQRLGEMLVGKDIANEDERPEASTSTKNDRWINVAAACLLVVGLAQMTGDLLGLPALKGIATATGCSPLPKVFTAHKGVETYSTSFFIEWTDLNGRAHSQEVTPQLYSHLEGPYNRRNIYGAVLSYGPVLYMDQHARPMFDAIAGYGIGGSAPLLRELGIEPGQIAGNVRVRYEPVVGSSWGNMPKVLEVKR